MYTKLKDRRTEQSEYKVCMEKILEFIHLIPEIEDYERENLTTKDYTNTQFISWLEKHLPKEYNCLYEFQKMVGIKIQKLGSKSKSI